MKYPLKRWHWLLLALIAVLICILSQEMLEQATDSTRGAIQRTKAVDAPKTAS